MKRAYLIAAVSMVTIASFGQHANSTFAASHVGVDRMSMIKNSISVPSWHEKSFWPVYENFRNKIEPVSAQMYVAMSDLAAINNATTDEEALNNAQQVIELRRKELELRRQYFAEIGVAFNGIIAMQFLQTETVFNLVESSQVYDATNWRKFKFYPAAWKDGTQLRAAKYHIISKAVGLSPEKAHQFYSLYAMYEEECDQLLGSDYSVIGLYAGEPSDFTPGLAKRLGYDLMTITERELVLKDKYFNEMKEQLGPVVAAKFLVWEDYYSLISKMSAWSEGSN